MIVQKSLSSTLNASGKFRRKKKLVRTPPFDFASHDKKKLSPVYLLFFDVFTCNYGIKIHKNYVTFIAHNRNSSTIVSKLYVLQMTYRIEDEL